MNVNGLMVGMKVSTSTRGLMYPVSLCDCRSQGEMEMKEMMAEMEMLMVGGHGMGGMAGLV